MLWVENLLQGSALILLLACSFSMLMQEYTSFQHPTPVPQETRWYDEFQDTTGDIVSFKFPALETWNNQRGSTGYAFNRTHLRVTMGNEGHYSIDGSTETCGGPCLSAYMKESIGIDSAGTVEVEGKEYQYDMQVYARVHRCPSEPPRFIASAKITAVDYVRYCNINDGVNHYVFDREEEANPLLKHMVEYAQQSWRIFDAVVNFRRVPSRAQIYMNSAGVATLD